MLLQDVAVFKPFVNTGANVSIKSLSVNTPIYSKVFVDSSAEVYIDVLRVECYRKISALMPIFFTTFNFVNFLYTLLFIISY